MGRPPKFYSDVELAALRDRRNELRREEYRLDGGKRRADNKAWKDAHRERVRKAGREYQRRVRKLNPERVRWLTREWRRKNIEKARESYKKWYKKYGAEYTRKWHAAKRKTSPERYLLFNARARAKKGNMSFNITLDDVTIPKMCPVLGIKMEVGHGKKNCFFNPSSPSLDRFDSSKGYIKGNVFVISWRANMLKRDGTLDEFRRIVKYMESHIDL